MQTTSPLNCTTSPPHRCYQLAPSDSTSHLRTQCLPWLAWVLIVNSAQRALLGKVQMYVVCTVQHEWKSPNRIVQCALYIVHTTSLQYRRQRSARQIPVHQNFANPPCSTEQDCTFYIQLCIHPLLIKYNRHSGQGSLTSMCAPI